MFFSGALSIVLALSASALAGPVNDKRTSFKSSVVEKLLTPPAGWVEVPSAQVNKDVDTITLRIHLVQQDLEKFQEMAINVSRNSIIQICNLLTIEIDCDPRT
jgi:tripeptidyl-peptidase-1